MNNYKVKVAAAMEALEHLTEKRINVPISDFKYNCVFPTYRETTVGKWSLVLKPDHPVPAYFNGVLKMGHEVPVLFKEDRVWMSVTPMECESHLPHLMMIDEDWMGDIAVVGLGLGYFPYQVIAHGLAWDITVYEKDQEVIDLFHAITEDQESWQGVKEHMHIIKQDVLDPDWDTDLTFDYVYVDIWPKMMDYSMARDTFHICERLQPTAISFWTQECEFVLWCAKRELNPAEITPDHWIEFASDLNLPLQFPEEVDMDWYIKCCFHAATTQLYATLKR